MRKRLGFTRTFLLLILFSGAGLSAQHMMLGGMGYRGVVQQPPPPDTGPTQFYVDEEYWYTSLNGSGPVEVARSVGSSRTDGVDPLRAGGTTFTHGLGVFPLSEVCYKVSTATTNFRATVGVDDAITSGGAIIFIVESPNGSERYRTPTKTSTDSNTVIDVVLPASPTEVCLRVEAVGGASANNKAAWGDARFVSPTAPPSLCDVSGAVHVSAGTNLIAAALTTAGAGGFVCLEDGIHKLTTKLTNLGEGVTIIGRSRNAIVRGGEVLTGWTQLGSNYFVGGQTQQGSTDFYIESPNVLPSDFCHDLIGPVCEMPEDLTINGVWQRREASLGACTINEWFFDYAADRIYVCGQNPTGKEVITSILNEFINDGSNNIRLLDFTWEYFASELLRYTIHGGSGWRIEGIEARFNHGGGVNNLCGSIIRKSYLHHNGEYGVAGDTCSSGEVFEMNEVAYNGLSGLSQGWGAGGSKWARVTGLYVRDNFTHHNSGPGFWTDIDNFDTVYDNNRMEDNGRAGIFHEGSGNAIIKNNKGYRNGTTHYFGQGSQTIDSGYWLENGCLEILDSWDVEVFGNLCVDNDKGITTVEDARGGNHPPSAGAWGLHNVSVHDNTIVITVDKPITHGWMGQGDISGTDYTTQVAWANNTYWFPLGSTRNYFQTQANGLSTGLGTSHNDAGWIALSNTTNETINRATWPGDTGNPQPPPAGGTCATGAITLEQAATTNSQNNAGSVSVSLGTAPDTGCVIVACHFTVDINSQGPAGWTEVAAVTNTTENDQLAMYYRVVQNGDPTSYTFTSAAANQTVVMREFSGIDTANVVHVTGSTGRTPAVTSLSAGSVTTTQAETLALACIANKGTVTSPSWNQSFIGPTHSATNSGATDATLLSVYKILAAAGGVTTTASWSTAATSMGIIATLKGLP